MGLVVKLIGCIWDYLGEGAKAFMTPSLELSLTVPLREGGSKEPLFLCAVHCRSLGPLVNSHFLFLSRALRGRQ